MFYIFILSLFQLGFECPSLTLDFYFQILRFSIFLLFPKVGALGLDHTLSILYSTATGILLGGPMGPINPVWGNGCNIFVAIHISPPSKGRQLQGLPIGPPRNKTLSRPMEKCLKWHPKGSGIVFALVKTLQTSLGGTDFHDGNANFCHFLIPDCRRRR